MRVQINTGKRLFDFHGINIIFPLCDGNFKINYEGNDIEFHYSEIVLISK